MLKVVSVLQFYFVFIMFVLLFDLFLFCFLHLSKCTVVVESYFLKEMLLIRH